MIGPRSQAARQRSVSLREICRRQTKSKVISMMYCVYILKSLSNSDIYIGSTGNLVKRVNHHNGGKVRATKGYRPWKLLEYQKFNSRSDAVRREKFLKTGQQREILKKKYR